MKELKSNLEWGLRVLYEEACINGEEYDDILDKLGKLERLAEIGAVVEWCANMDYKIDALCVTDWDMIYNDDVPKLIEVYREYKEEGNE